MTDTHETWIDIALAKSRATTDAKMHFQGAHTVCPYKVGTKERAAYEEQWRRMLKLAGEL